MTIPQRLTHALCDAYVIFVLILSSGAFLSLVVDPNDPTLTSQGSPVLKTAWAVIYIFSLIRIISRRKEAVELIADNKQVMLLLALASLSWLWSIDRAATAHAVVTLCLSAFVALDISIHYSIERQLQLVCIALVLVIALGVLADAFLPGLVPGSDFEGAAWHGAFGRKNEFGRIICLALTACFTLIQRSTRLKGFIVASGIGLALLSKSVSALGYVSLMILVVMMWSVFRWKPRPRKVGIALVVMIAALGVIYVSQNFVRITYMLDKDPTMTSRVDLWELSISAIRERPFLGHGYEAFWGATSPSAERIREGVNWDAPHSHDGYIDLALSLGLSGLFAYCLMYLTAAMRAYAFLMEGDENYRKWPLSLLTVVFIYQLTESSMVTGNTVFWILFCSIAFSLTSVKEEVVAEEPFLLGMPLT